MSDPVRNLWDAVSSANVRAIADQLYPPNLHVYPSMPAADEVKADVVVAHRDLDSSRVVWVKDEPTCYACGGEATHEIPWRGQWLDVCDDPACTGE